MFVAVLYEREFSDPLSSVLVGDARRSMLGHGGSCAPAGIGLGSPSLPSAGIATLQVPTPPASVSDWPSCAAGRKPLR